MKQKLDKSEIQILVNAATFKQDALDRNVDKLINRFEDLETKVIDALRKQQDNQTYLKSLKRKLSKAKD